jgi:hypothetical protein
MKQEQKFFLSMKATSEEGSSESKLELKREMECSIQFLASAIKSAMDEDEILMSAIAMATLDYTVSIDIDKFKEKLKDLTGKK